MQILGKIEQKQRSFSHGGCEVLRLLWDVPTGDTPAAAHFIEMTHRLCAYAEQILLPDAAEALTRMAAQGQAYRFARRRFRVALKVAPAGRYMQVTLSLTLTAGEELLFHRELCTLWDSTGCYQLRSSERFKSAKPAKKRHKKGKNRERGKKKTDSVA